MPLGASWGDGMAVLGAPGGVTWATLGATLAWSGIPPGKEFALVITGACWQGGGTLLGTGALTVVDWGNTAGGAEEGGAEKGGAVILVATA